VRRVRRAARASAQCQLNKFSGVRNPTRAPATNLPKASARTAGAFSFVRYRPEAGQHAWLDPTPAGQAEQIRARKRRKIELLLVTNQIVTNQTAVLARRGGNREESQ
jgi:hypothetical protein